MIIPGWVITIFTFPGVIVHEFAHQIFCRWMRVAIFDVCYFRIGTPAGYVVHEKPRTEMQHLVIGIGPFLVNTIIGALIAFPAAIPVLKFDSGNLLDYALVWLGVSIAMHAFPSTGDAQSIWQSIKHEGAPLVVRALATPIVVLIYLGAFGSIFWLDLLYGAGVALLGPTVLIRLLA